MPKPSPRTGHVTLGQARSAKAAVLKRFQKLGISASVGITRIDNDYAVKVNVGEPQARSVNLPERIEGVSICIEVTGVVRARTD
jgi:hypothetical protein